MSAAEEREMSSPTPDFTRSEAAQTRLHELVPGGAHTYAASIRQAFADLTYKHTGKKPKLKELPRP